MLFKWPYSVHKPPPWSTMTVFPYPFIHSATMTMPSDAACTLVPIGTAKSTPLCILPTSPVIGCVRRPNGEETYPPETGLEKMPLPELYEEPPSELTLVVVFAEAAAAA